jgi:hypothetical protein
MYFDILIFEIDTFSSNQCVLFDIEIDMWKRSSRVVRERLTATTEVVTAMGFQRPPTHRGATDAAELNKVIKMRLRLIDVIDLLI